MDVAALHAAVDGIRARPGAGHYRFFAVNRWLDGSKTRTTVNGCKAGNGDEHPRTRPLVVESDVPAFLPGGDRGMDPLELLLAAVGACLTRTLVWHASILGVHLDAVDVQVEGDIDLAGWLGVDDRVSAGYRQIHIAVLLEAEVSSTALDDLLRIAIRLSPVCNTVTQFVSLKVGRAGAASPVRSRTHRERAGGRK
ncbi:MAG: OsmC family protein [Gammaproteobacteria bacterium]|nr:OsmC family protein [Gammaproteobacteria bacterium]